MRNKKCLPDQLCFSYVSRRPFPLQCLYTKSLSPEYSTLENFGYVWTENYVTFGVRFDSDVGSRGLGGFHVVSNTHTWPHADCAAYSQVTNSSKNS